MPCFSIGLLVDDEFELGELIQTVEDAFEVKIGDTEDITVGELADMIASQS